MIYSTVMDIPAVQQLAVTGVPDGLLIRMISLKTNAVIYFPTVADRHFDATVFYLLGSVPAIIKARKYIQVYCLYLHLSILNCIFFFNIIWFAIFGSELLFLHSIFHIVDTSFSTANHLK